MSEDRALRNLFSHLKMVRALLEGFVKEPWVQAIDWNHPQPRLLKTKHVTRGLVERESDVAWLLGWPEPKGSQVCVTVEAQTTLDPIMPLRGQVYAALLQHGLVRYEGISTPTGVVASILLYTGKKLWEKPLSVAELTLPMGHGLDKCLSRFEYILIDARRAAVELEGENLAGSLFQMLVVPIADWNKIFEWVLKELSAPEDRDLRDAFAEAATVGLRKHYPREKWPEKPTLEGVTTMLSERVAEWKAENIQTGRLEGRLEGLAEGHFGATAARAVTARLAEGNGSVVYAAVHQLIKDCATADEFLRRIKTV